jgi:hypothetical protein
MTEIKIVVDVGLAERAGRVNRKTYVAIKKANGINAFYPDGTLFDYIVFAVDEELSDNTLVVSRDVKELCYKNRTSLSF